MCTPLQTFFEEGLQRHKDSFQQKTTIRTLHDTFRQGTNGQCSGHWMVVVGQAVFLLYTTAIFFIETVLNKTPLLKTTMSRTVCYQPNAFL